MFSWTSRGDRLLGVGRNTDVQLTEHILTFGREPRATACINTPSGQVPRPPPCTRTIYPHPPTSAPKTAMAHMRRASVSSTHRNRSESPLVFLAASNADTDEWVKAWKLVTAHGTNHSRQYVSCIWTGSDATPPDLVESPVVAIDADKSVEVACDVRRLCGCYACHFRVDISSLDPLVIRCSLSGHPSKRFLLSGPI